MTTEVVHRKNLGRKLSAETRAKLSAIHTGKKMSLESRIKMSLAKKGKPSPVKGLHWKMSEETKLKISLAQRGEKCWRWKGGKTRTNSQIRGSSEYKWWRRAVFKRDNFACIWCKEASVKIQADHILPFAKFPEWRLEINNGRTLCVPCHRSRTYKWARLKPNLLKEQI